MISANHVGEELLAFIERRLAADEAARIESHLRGCDACRAELAALRETYSAVADSARALTHLPVNTVRGWEAVRRRWQTPLPIGLPGASRARNRSWQVSASMAVAAMVFVSGVSLGAARASAPSVPYIQTPAAVVIRSDTPTLSATHPAMASHTPTLTPAPIQTY